jgi:hypothetical protein
MTAVAPLPAGFPPPIDADKLPPAPAEPPAAVVTPPRHPLEAWAEPSPFAQTIRRPLPDGSGYLNATATALQRLADAEAQVRRMAGPGILHASERARLQREREDAAEAERKTRNPEAMLQQAHRLQAEARAEVDRLAPLATRAAELVVEIEDRARAQEAEAKTARTAATEALIEALAVGEAPPPVSHLTSRISTTQPSWRPQRPP